MLEQEIRQKTNKELAKTTFLRPTPPPLSLGQMSLHKVCDIGWGEDVMSQDLGPFFQPSKYWNPVSQRREHSSPLKVHKPV